MYSGPLLALYGGRDVTSEVWAMLKDEGTVSVAAKGYATRFTDNAVGEDKTFTLVTVNESEGFIVNHFEDNDACDVTPGYPTGVSSAPASAPLDSVVRVTHASYGGKDVMESFAQILHAVGAFRCNAPHKVFGDPAPGVRKAFVVGFSTTKGDGGVLCHTAHHWMDGAMIDVKVTYDSISDGPPTIVEATYGGHDVTALARAVKGPIVVEPGQYASWLSGDPLFVGSSYNAFAVVTNKMKVHVYDDEDKCDLERDAFDGFRCDRTDSIEVRSVLRASYGGMDVTSRLQTYLSENDGVFTTAPDVAFGDPMVGTVKAFVVAYLSEFEGTPDRDVNYWLDGQAVAITVNPAAVQRGPEGRVDTVEDVDSVVRGFEVVEKDDGEDTVQSQGVGAGPEVAAVADRCVADAATAQQAEAARQRAAADAAAAQQAEAARQRAAADAAAAQQAEAARQRAAADAAAAQQRLHETCLSACMTDNLFRHTPVPVVPPVDCMERENEYLRAQLVLAESRAEALERHFGVRPLSPKPKEDETTDNMCAALQSQLLEARRQISVLHHENAKLRDGLGHHESLRCPCLEAENLRRKVQEQKTLVKELRVVLQWHLEMAK